MDLLVACDHVLRFIYTDSCNSKGNSDYLALYASLLCKHIEDEGVIVPG